MAASGVTSHTYGPEGQVEFREIRRVRAFPPTSTPGSESRHLLSKTVRRAWESEPLELQRDILRLSAVQTGIAGRTGSYSQAAERTGFARELQRIAGPKEIGPLAQAYARAWGRPIPVSSMF